ncbi:MAG: PLP-dependent aminotransferase family protein [Planctomycetes bacterium]|nr:PLP-dependent aminotransferase family protein [Planctomycetota bacterium]
MSPTLPELDRSATAPLTAQIADHFAAAIEQGQLRAGDRLPPIRELARRCAVTRATVQDAYRQLAERRLVEGTVGRGTVVCAGAVPMASRTAVGNGLPLSPFATAALRRTLEMPGAPTLGAGQRLVANFAELAPDSGRFPVDEWRAAMDAVLLRSGPELLGYGMAANGLPELREAFAARAAVAEPAAPVPEVLVTGGAQQALDLALRAFCAPGDTVVVTDPSYHQMFGLLKAHGLEVAAVPFGRDGLDLDRLQHVLARGGVRLVYLMPTFHNPTGRTLDRAQRERLVEVLAGTEVPVVEDEYQQSLRFRGEPLPTLRSLDPRGLTVTVASASKELFPALRIGWVLGASRVLQPMAAVKRFVDLETSPLLQAALVEFLARGAFDRYLGELRAELARRHAALAGAARESLPAECHVGEADGGYVAWLEMPRAGQADRLTEMASERGVRVVPGRAFDPFDRPSSGVRLSLTRADCDAIRAGVAVLGDCAREIVADPVATPFL